MPARYGITVEDYRVVRAAADPQDRAIEDEPLPEQAGFRRVDDDQAIIAAAFFTGRLLDDLSDSSFFVEFAHRLGPMRADGGPPLG